MGKKEQKIVERTHQNALFLLQSHSLRSGLQASRQAQFILLDHIHSIYTLTDVAECVFATYLISFFLLSFPFRHYCFRIHAKWVIETQRNFKINTKKNCTKNFTDVNDDGDIQYTAHTKRISLWFHADVFMYSECVLTDVSVAIEEERQKQGHAERGILYMVSKPWHVRVHLVEITTKQIINFLCECNLVEHTGKTATTATASA